MPSALQTTAAYVSVDLEGCADVVHWDEVRPSERAEYRRSRHVMTAETNAVLDGLIAGGAMRVVVNDAHSAMRNLIAERLHSSVELVGGRFKPLFMLEGIGTQFAAACFVGYHGAIGDARAVMGHTYSPRVVYECRLNGEPVGEVTINAALAGHFGVPVVLVSGDRATLDEARRVLPWAVCVETKRSISYHAAECIAPGLLQERLRDTARHAMSNATNAKAYALCAPISIEIDTLKTAHADLFCLIPGCRRIAPRTVEYRADDMPAVYRALVAMIYLGSAVPA